VSGVPAYASETAVSAPREGWDAYQQRDPESIPEHRHAVPFMPVVRAWFIMTGVSRRSMLSRDFARRVGSVRHRVAVIVRFRRGRVHSWTRLHRRGFDPERPVWLCPQRTLATGHGRSIS